MRISKNEKQIHHLHHLARERCGLSGERSEVVMESVFIFIGEFSCLVTSSSPARVLSILAAHGPRTFG
jgi:hypothetical protein